MSVLVGVPDIETGNQKAAFPNGGLKEIGLVAPSAIVTYGTDNRVDPGRPSDVQVERKSALDQVHKLQVTVALVVNSLSGE